MIKKLTWGSFIFFIITFLWVFLDTSKAFARAETYSCRAPGGTVTITSTPLGGNKTKIKVSVSGLKQLQVAHYKVLILENTIDSGWSLINDSGTDIGKGGSGEVLGTFNSGDVTSGNLMVLVQHNSLTGTKEPCTITGFDSMTSSPPPAGGGGGGGGSSAAPAGGGGGGGGSAPDPLGTVKKVTQWGYMLAFPIAVVIAVIKILINLIVLATSAGDPTKLQQVREELYAILMGLLLIGGAATLINILGRALGV